MCLEKKKSRIGMHWGFMLVLLCLLHVTYYGNVFKWLSGSFSIGTGSFERTASILLLMVLYNGSLRRGVPEGEKRKGKTELTHVMSLHRFFLIVFFHL